MAIFLALCGGIVGDICVCVCVCKKCWIVGQRVDLRIDLWVDEKCVSW